MLTNSIATLLLLTVPLAPELAGLGSLEYRVTTKVPQAQRFFNQGLRLLYGFNHSEALRAFQEASRLDPGLAMAHWGQAIALGPNLNAPMSPENGRLAYQAVQRARAIAGSGNERERALIAALSLRYAADGQGDRPSLDRAYAAAMSKLAERHPDDPEIQVLSADAVMNTMPWDYWQKDGKAKTEISGVIASLERVIGREPDHPGAHHYYIHVMEASATPERAEASADRLGSLMPAAGHMVHMPAHIYLRVGRYADAAEANVRAIAADEDYLSQCRAQGLYPVSYYPHNLHFLWAAATLEGRRAAAIDAARQVAAKVPHHHAGALAWTADFPVTPMLAYVRFGQWRDILTEPSPPSHEPYAIGIWRYARGLAFVAENRLDRAESELTELQRVMTDKASAAKLKDTPLLTNLQIASRIVAGELAARQARWAEAIRFLEEAVSIEDAIPYNEPPLWHQPPRQVLGALLLEAGQPAKAEMVYRKDLERFRDNGWSLFGLWQSLVAQQRQDDARDVRARFDKAWQRADVTLMSSRVMPRAEKFITLSTGVRMEYVEQGSPDGIPLVFLHGVTDSWRSFEPVLQRLPSTIHAFAISQRGHGDSSRPETGYRFTDLSNDLQAFMDAVGLPRAIVAGHSMGASVAQRFVVDHPERVSAVVLMGSFTTYDDPGMVDFYKSAIAPLTDPIGPAFAREWQLSTVAREIPPEFLDMVVVESQKVPARLWRELFTGFISAPDITPELRRVSVPALLVWGTRDAYALRAAQNRLLEVIPSSRLLAYEEAGHAIHWEDPQRFADDLAAFVTQAS